MSTTTTALLDVLDLADIERSTWPARRAALHLTGVPRNEGDPPEDPPKDGAPPRDEPPKDDPPKDPPTDEALGDGGKAALAAERKRAKEAEKALKDAQTRLDELEAKDATELEKAQKRVEQLESKAGGATEKLRKANLIASLADEGLTGAKAKAAARLLDGVEYDEDSDEPTNLQDAIKAATAEYGEDMFKPAKGKGKPPPANGGGGGEDREGPELTADELAAAKASGMSPEEYAEFKKPQPKLPDKKK
jgi:hypothetical protein